MREFFYTTSLSTHSDRTCSNCIYDGLLWCGYLPSFRPNICGMVTGAVCTFVFQAHYPFFNAMLYFQGVVVIALCLAAASQVACFISDMSFSNSP